MRFVGQCRLAVPTSQNAYSSGGQSDTAALSARLRGLDRNDINWSMIISVDVAASERRLRCSRGFLPSTCNPRVTDR